MSMRFTIYDSVGRKGAQIWLALRKSDVANRLLNVLQNHDLAKGGPVKFGIGALTAIDAGTFSVHSLSALGYSTAEITEAITRRIDEINTETDELRGLERLLHDGSFAAAQGGREREIKRDWRETVTGARKSLANANLNLAQKMTKSRAMGGTSARDILMAHSFEQAQGGHGFTEFHSGAHPGHVVQVNDETQEWTHTQGGPGGKVVAKSKREASVAQAVASLNSHLVEFREI